jgi:Sortase domain
MTEGTWHSVRSHRSKPWWLVAAALLLIGTGCLAVGVSAHRHPLAAPAVSRMPVRATTPAVIPLGAVRSVPVSMIVPAIGLAVSLSSLGLNLDGTVQVPTDDVQPGWFRFGPSPGQIGSAVILGHVDSYKGPGVFFNLRSLVAGDTVDVGLTDGVIDHFVVSSVAMYPRAQFPAQQVYGSHGRSELQLVTCGGVFDARTGSYLSNIVVYTTLAAVTPAPNGDSS